MNQPLKQHQPSDEDFQWVEMDESDLLYLLRKHARLLILVPAVTMLLALVICLVMKPVFSSTAKVYLRPNFDQEMQVERGSTKLDDADSLRSIELSLNSDTIILRMVNRLGLRYDAGFLGETWPEGEPLSDAKLLKKIRKRYNTELFPNTRLVELSVKDYSAERTQLIAETMIEEFLNHLREDRQAKEVELRAALVTQTEVALNSALQAEQKLEAFRSANPQVLVEQDSRIYHDRLLQRGQALNQANSEKSQLAGMVAAIQSINPATEPWTIFQVLRNRNADYLSKLLEMHSGAKAQLATASKQYGHLHTNYRTAVSRLQEVEGIVQRYATEMKSSLDSEFLAADGKVKELNESLNELQRGFAEFKSLSAGFRGIQEEIDRNWNTYTELQQKIKDLDLNPEVKPTFVTPVSNPLIPDKKSHPKTLFWLAGGMLFGAVIVGACVLFINRNGLPFTNQNQIPNGLGLPTIASLADGTELQRDQMPQFLNMMIALRDHQSIHITSAGGPQGASFLPRILSQEFGNIGLRTLLISVANENNQEPRIPPVGPNIFLQSLPLQKLLKPNEFRRWLSSAQKTYDRIILDTAGLHEVDTLLAVSEEADATVFVVREGECNRKTSREFVSRSTSLDTDYGVYLYKHLAPFAATEKQQSPATLTDSPASASPQPERKQTRPEHSTNILDTLRPIRTSPQKQTVEQREPSPFQAIPPSPSAHANQQTRQRKVERLPPIPPSPSIQTRRQRQRTLFEAS